MFKFRIDDLPASIAYYPGCTLHGLARDYDRTLRDSAKALGVDLVELPDWNCCGGPASMADREATAELARRNAAKLNEAGHDTLAVACAWCYHNLATAADEHDEIDMTVTHIVDALCARPIVDELTRRHAATLKDDPERDLLPVPCAVYYGCLLTRPGRLALKSVTEHDGPVERMLRALGLPVIDWPMRERCCGAWHGFSNPQVAERLSGEPILAAEAAGAKAMVTACPLCHYNLDAKQYEIGRRLGRKVYMPIYHFSEVLAYAVAPDSAERAQSRHINSDRALVDEMLADEGQS